MVIAAFTYPFAVKLRLSAAGLYQLNDKEMGACDALDKLLDSHWGKGWQKPPSGRKSFRWQRATGTMRPWMLDVRGYD